MPKARRRTGRPQTGIRTIKGVTTQPRTTSAKRSAVVPATPTLMNRPFFSPVVRGPQSLVMPGMVALGCWLMAFTMFFLSTDPNRNLFGSMAVLIALLWSFSFSVRVRKVLQQRTVS